MLTTEALVKLKVGRVIEGADERRLPLAFTSFRGSRTENPKLICDPLGNILDIAEPTEWNEY